MHAGYRWFCRLDFHEKVPDRTTLVKFRRRCREHGLWEDLFHRIVTQCRDVGLLSGRHLMADSTQVQANASVKSLWEIESNLIEMADRICADEEPAAKPKPADDHHRPFGDSYRHSVRQHHHRFAKRAFGHGDAPRVASA